MSWNDVLLNTINTLLGLIVTVAIPYLFNMIRVKMKADLQLKYLEKVENLVATAVTEVQQTYVSEMRKAGSFDKEAQIKAFNMAKEAVLSMMNEKTKEIVTEAVGDFEAYIKGKIEAAVYDTKYFEH